MNLRRALFIAACVSAAALGPAAAQSAQQQGSVWDSAPQPGAPSASVWGPSQPAAAPPPQASPWDRPQQQPPCVAELVKLRDAADKRAGAIRAASERKASPKEACGLFNALAAAQTKMIKYALDNQQSCGIPAQFIDQMKQTQNQIADIRGKVCNAAAQPQRPAGPSLSDALNTPVPNANNIKTGRGTFDTLTGTPLGNR